MSVEPEKSGSARRAAWVVAALGTLLLGGGIVWLMNLYTRPAPLTQDRNALRQKNLQEVRAAEAEAATTYAWVDQGKGLVRLPVARALELAAREWAEDPKAGRAILQERLQKLTAKVPEPKSEFE